MHLSVPKPCINNFTQKTRAGFPHGRSISVHSVIILGLFNDY